MCLHYFKTSTWSNIVIIVIQSFHNLAHYHLMYVELAIQISTFLNLRKSGQNTKDFLKYKICFKYGISTALSASLADRPGRGRLEFLLCRCVLCFCRGCASRARSCRPGRDKWRQAIHPLVLRSYHRCRLHWHRCFAIWLRRWQRPAGLYLGPSLATPFQYWFLLKFIATRVLA